MRKLAMLCLCLLAFTASAADAPAKFKLSKVAVVVFAQSPAAAKLSNSALSRLEQILTDSNVTAIDKDEAEKLKKGWKQLEDPSYLITADDFVKNAEKYKLDGLIRVYLTTDSAQPFPGVFSATAQADVRVVDAEANVDAKTTFPMGGPGRPPSDGLTEQAATINAVQRAIDDAAIAMGLTVLDPASPRAISFKLEGPVEVPADAQVANIGAQLDATGIKVAQLFTETWKEEEVTCNSKAPGGELGLVGGYISEMPRGDRFPHHGSRVHIVDVQQNREITTFEAQEVGRKSREQRGTSSLLACSFLMSWRYAAGVTGDYLTVWDVERGLQMARILLPFGLDKTASLQLNKTAAETYLTVSGDGSRKTAYKLVVNKGGNS